MSKKRPLKSIPLSDREEAALIELAATLGCYALTGPTSGMPSWRRLVAELADGEFVIRRRARSAPPPAPVAPDPEPAPAVAAEVDTGLPLWWPRDDNGSLKVYVPADDPLAPHCKALGLALTKWGYEARNEWIAVDENRNR